MNNKKIGAIAGVILLLVGGATLLTTGQQVDCKAQYDKLVDGNITSSEEIAPECKPIPEEIGNKVLMKALGNTG